MHTSHTFHTIKGAVTLSLRSLSQAIHSHPKTVRTFLPSKETGEHSLPSSIKYIIFQTWFFQKKNAPYTKHAQKHWLCSLAYRMQQNVSFFCTTILFFILQHIFCWKRFFSNSPALKELLCEACR